MDEFDSDPNLALALAHRTEERRATSLHHTLDGAAAARRHAMLAFAVVDAKIMLEHAKLAVGLLMIPQRGAASLDGILQHRLDRLHQPLGALVGRAHARRNGRSATLGREPRPMQRLAHIDVAEPR